MSHQTETEKKLSRNLRTAAICRGIWNPPPSKDDLRAMLAEAAANTAQLPRVTEGSVLLLDPPVHSDKGGAAS